MLIRWAELDDPRLRPDGFTVHEDAGWPSTGNPFRGLHGAEQDLPPLT